MPILITLAVLFALLGLFFWALGGDICFALLPFFVTLMLVIFIVWLK